MYEKSRTLIFWLTYSLYSTYIPSPTYGLDLDIVVEAKAKELAVLKYKEIHNDIRTNS